ncbi:MAG: sulfate adenylyltransferase [Candidatus Marinimicrobia bacterium]|nr:sulfate adenylyltransferase [Candidatus Neomarinimicrobiota bacterium]|tara:strand:+ start:1950 stop:4187 length:2238 start_codon:yes stop_codon:yes gene_type:complete
MNQLIVTLGPSTNTFEKISTIKARGVDFVRINMSHSSIEDLNYFIYLSKKANIPFIIDTEGSQVRTGNLNSKSISFSENQTVELHKNEFIGNKQKISIRPSEIIDQLKVGDILYVDFDTLALLITDTKTITHGFIKAKIISSGSLGSNKGIVIDPQINREINLPVLTAKDIEAIKLGLKNNISHVAASFMRDKNSVKYVRRISKNKMKIISKIECKDALHNLNDIILESDFLLIDRGDLSKEIPIEKIPFTQKIIIDRAKSHNKKVFVATNLLESMILNRKPTRAEVHDIINTIVDGAYGLTLAAETAIGKYPIGCINMLYKIIKHSTAIIDTKKTINKEKEFISFLESKDYLLDDTISSSLIKPHGGELINRYNSSSLTKNELSSLKKIQLTENQKLDAFQIAVGAYSPLKGFMTKIELETVLENMILPNDIIWPIPILLDIEEHQTNKMNIGETVALTDNSNSVIGIMKIEDLYKFDKKLIQKKLYHTNDITHPGVRQVNTFKPIFIGGKIHLFNKINMEHNHYNLTPRQTRRLFDEKNWSKVVGFHTRNVIHRAHEHIQLSALDKSKCDGLFIHPVIGQKKSGDYNSNIIIKSYEIMRDFYPDNKVVFGVLSTYSRYAQEREAIFTAICRKNYGCSHFIIGRDHTGVGNNKNNAHDIFSKIPNLDIEIIKFNNVHYSTNDQKYIEQASKTNLKNKKSFMAISGTEAREMLSQLNKPPTWYMRPEISDMIIDSIKSNKEVFIP